MNAEGVVLRGEAGTELHATGGPRENSLIQLGVNDTLQWPAHLTACRVETRYVPSGTAELEINCSSTTYPKVGQEIQVLKPLTREWAIEMFYGATQFNCTGWWNDHNCSAKHTESRWCPASESIIWDRKIILITKRTITLDAPISDHINLTLGYGWVLLNTNSSTRLQNIAVEDLVVSASAVKSTSSFDRDYYKLFYNTFMEIDNVEHAWVRNIKLFDFNSALDIKAGGRFVTVQDVSHVSSLLWEKTGPKPTEFSVSGQQNLFLRCSSNTTRVFSLGSRARAAGPNVFLDADVSSPAQPHMRWATGILIDSATGFAPQFVNRQCKGLNSESGTAHGWAVGFSVIWNGDFTASGTNIMLERATERATNWAIGSLAGGCQPGTKSGHECVLQRVGICNQINKPVQPSSLFRAQVEQRLQSHHAI